MRTLFLHIGFHKTGSSSIQLSLQNNKEQLLEYSWEFLSDHKSGNSSGCISVHDKYTWIEYKIKPSFYELIDQSTQDNVIISAEHLSFITDENEIEKLYQYLSSRFDKIVVISFLRRQDKLAKSFKDQAAKTVTYKSNPASILCGHSPELLPELTPPVIEYFDFNQKLILWSKYFQKENILAFNFDDAIKHKVGICCFFSEIIDLPIKLPEVKTNESVTHDTSRLWHIYNQLMLTKEELQKLKSNSREILIKKEKTKENYIKGSKEFYEYFLDSNERLKTNFGCEFSTIENPINHKQKNTLPNKEILINDLLKLINNVNKNEIIESLKNASYELEKHNKYSLSLEMIELAFKLRPNGHLIKQQRKYLKNLLKNEKTNKVLTIKERVNYYLSDINNRQKDLSKLDNKFIFDKPFLFSCQSKYESYENNQYVKDLRNLLSSIDEELSIPVQIGDKTNTSQLILFTKARNIQNKNSILLKLNTARHFGVNPKKVDLDWNNKKDTPIWRGASTGYNKERELFVEQYHEKYNIGFSHLVQNKNIDDKYIKGKVSIEEQLKYKFIISLEGNDVASNLKWILASNSVPIMKKPTKETWAMEGLLEPFVHYLPLDDDLSNLDTILDWANNNNDTCENIAFNGKVFMSQFSNPDTELEIQRQLILHYKMFIDQRVLA